MSATEESVNTPSPATSIATTMMHQPLLVSSILQQAAVNTPSANVITRSVEGGIVTHNYRQVMQRSCQLANALVDLGMVEGDRVATLAWNTHRHLEAYYGISGMGAVIHTVNPRLFDEQIVYIINHAQDRLLFIDISFIELVKRIEPQLISVEKIVVLSTPDYLPADRPGWLSYEHCLSQQPSHFDWPQLDELAPACICYTSGTTGDPKGVVYSHRSTVLHAMASCQPNALNLSVDTVVMPVVPMYHVCAWGLPYSALMSGATMVLPGAGMDGASLQELIDYSRADLLLGVPTVWLGLLAYLDSSGLSIPSVTTVAVGGAAAPAALVKALAARNIYLMPLWGMTETSPLATFGRKNLAVAAMSSEQQLAVQTSAGRNIWGVELQVCNEQGDVLPRDGVHSGALQVRGHWVTSGYVGEGERLQPGQWFDTGDVATIDTDGYLRIVDRKKDVIKSGGEWISSIALENAALAHPSVQEACVVGVAHPKWDERPLLVVVLAQGHTLNKPSIRDLLATKMASWWLPDDIVSVDSLPYTATGKLQKNRLREQFSEHYACAGCGQQPQGA